MIGFKVIERTVVFKRDQSVKSTVDRIIHQTDDLRDAFAKQFSYPLFWADDYSYVQRIVLDAHNKAVDLYDLYSQEMGSEVMAAQWAAPDFFIDLERWFHGTLAASLA